MRSIEGVLESSRGLLFTDVSHAGLLWRIDLYFGGSDLHLFGFGPSRPNTPIGHHSRAHTASVAAISAPGVCNRWIDTRSAPDEALGAFGRPLRVDIAPKCGDVCQFMTGANLALKPNSRAERLTWELHDDQLELISDIWDVILRLFYNYYRMQQSTTDQLLSSSADSSSSSDRGQRPVLVAYLIVLFVGQFGFAIAVVSDHHFVVHLEPWRQRICCPRRTRLRR